MIELVPSIPPPQAQHSPSTHLKPHPRTSTQSKTHPNRPLPIHHIPDKSQQPLTTTTHHPLSFSQKGHHPHKDNSPLQEITIHEMTELVDLSQFSSVLAFLQKLNECPKLTQKTKVSLQLLILSKSQACGKQAADLLASTME